MPDLSHLTEEERKVIEDVLRRQREEEEREQEVIRSAGCFVLFAPLPDPTPSDVCNQFFNDS